MEQEISALTDKHTKWHPSLIFSDAHMTVSCGTDHQLKLWGKCLHQQGRKDRKYYQFLICVLEK